VSTITSAKKDVVFYSRVSACLQRRATQKIGFAIRIQPDTGIFTGHFNRIILLNRFICQIRAQVNCAVIYALALLIFLRAKAATAFSASWPSQFCPSVRPSVRLFVRPSHGWISQKRCKLGSPNHHRRLPGRL